MKGGSGGAGGAAVQVAPLALGLLGESAAATAAATPGGLGGGCGTAVGGVRQRLHFNYQVHLVLLLTGQRLLPRPVSLPACFTIAVNPPPYQDIAPIYGGCQSYCSCGACRRST